MNDFINSKHLIIILDLCIKLSSYQNMNNKDLMIRCKDLQITLFDGATILLKRSLHKDREKNFIYIIQYLY